MKRTIISLGLVMLAVSFSAFSQENIFTEKVSNPKKSPVSKQFRTSNNHKMSSVKPQVPVDLTEQYAKTLPNDTLAIEQHYLRAPETHFIIQDGVYYGDYSGIDLIETWALDVSDTIVRVLVVDGGFYDNPDIQFTEGVNFIEDKDDLNAPVALNFADNNYLLSSIKTCGADIDNHGTQVSGLLGAARDNEIGVAGGMNNIELVAANALNCGSGYLADVIRSVIYGTGVTDSGIIDANIPQISDPVNVINLSIAGAAPACPAQLQAAINLAVENGITVISSAGNAGANASDYYPGNCENVINVGATGITNMQAWENSNTGDDVDIFAPGTTPALLSGIDPTSIETTNGTSNSAPLVASVVGMMKRNSPTITDEAIVYLMKHTARDYGDVKVLDAASALQNAINWQEGNAGSIVHALQENTSCSQDSLINAFGDRFDLCNKVKVTFLDNIEKRDGVSYELIDILSGEVLARTPMPQAYISSTVINDSTEYGFNICHDGDCQTAPYSFTIDAITPSACGQ